MPDEKPAERQKPPATPERKDTEPKRDDEARDADKGDAGAEISVEELNSSNDE